MNSEETVRALDARELQAVLERDVDALMQIWSDDYVVTPPDHTPRDRAAVVDLLERRVIDYSETRRTVEHIRLRDSLAVTIGNEIVVPASAGAREMVRRFTHVWVHGEDGWRLLARHAHLVDGLAN